MNAWRNRVLLAQVLLLFPLVLFLSAVVADGVPLLAGPCARIIGWYVTRFWSLWVLLLALPLVAVMLGLVTLTSAREDRPANPRTAGETAMPRLLLATTGVGVLLLGVVVLHMAAN